MTHSIKDFDFSKLSAAERLMLAQKLWESVDEQVTAMPLTDGQRAELDRRLAVLETGKVQGIPWSAVRDTLRTRR
jgi:putative addiction module component (TIGR02574 family)